MMEDIQRFMYSMADWDTCPSEIVLTKDAWVRLYAECLRRCLVPEEKGPMWERDACISLYGPKGPVRIIYKTLTHV
jgi:hypothetical protein